MSSKTRWQKKTEEEEEKKRQEQAEKQRAAQADEEKPAAVRYPDPSPFRQRAQARRDGKAPNAGKTYDAPVKDPDWRSRNPRTASRLENAQAADTGTKPASSSKADSGALPSTPKTQTQAEPARKATEEKPEAVRYPDPSPFRQRAQARRDGQAPNAGKTYDALAQDPAWRARNPRTAARLEKAAGETKKQTGATAPARSTQRADAAPAPAAGGEAQKEIGQGLFGRMGEQRRLDRELDALYKEREQLRRRGDVSARELADKDAEINAKLREWTQMQRTAPGLGEQLKNTGARIGADVQGLVQQAMGSYMTLGEMATDPDVLQRLALGKMAADTGAQAAGMTLAPRRARNAAQQLAQEFLQAQQRVPQKVYTPENSAGVRMVQRGAENVERAMAGTSGAGRFAADTVNSIVSNAPNMALALIPGVGPALSLGTMGAQAAGGRAAELSMGGAPADEALLRGAVSGGIEVATESLPVGSWAEIFRGNGKSAVRNIVTQMLEEGSEEAVSYLANYAADLAAKDPNAEFSLEELLQSAGMGGVSGGVYGVAGVGLNRLANAYAARSAGAPGNAQDTQAPAPENAEALRNAARPEERRAPAADAAQAVEQAAQGDADAMRAVLDDFERQRAEAQEQAPAEQEQQEAAERQAWQAPAAQEQQAPAADAAQALEQAAQGDADAMRGALEAFERQRAEAQPTPRVADPVAAVQADPRFAADTDVQLTPQQQSLYRAGVETMRMSEQAAQRMAATWDGKSDAGAHASAFQAMYRVGQLGLAEDTAQAAQRAGADAALLDADVQRLAFRQGQAEAAVYGFSDEAQAVQTVAQAADANPRYTDAMRAAVKEGYTGGSPTVYLQAMQGMYDAGRTGAMDYDQALAANRSAAAMVGDTDVLRRAYDLGAAGVRAAADAPGRGAVAGSVRYEGGAATGSTQLPAEVLDATARKLGVDIRVVQNLTDGDGSEVNGHWAAGLAELAIGENSGNAFETLVHEQGHYIGSYNPEGWAHLRSEILGWYAGERGMGTAQRNVFDRYEDAYGDSAAGADEAARDLFAGVLSTEEGTRSFLEYIADDETLTAPEKRGILQTLRDMLDRLIESIRGLLRGGDATVGAAEGRRLAERADQLENRRALVQDFLTELETARQNAQAVAGETQTGSGAEQRQNAAAGEAPAAASEDVRFSTNERDTENTKTEKTASNDSLSASSETPAAWADDPSTRTIPEPGEDVKHSRPVRERNEGEDYPQARYSGKEQVSYNTLVALPDMPVTQLDTDSVVGMTPGEIMTQGMEGLTAVPGRHAVAVRNGYTGCDIAITRAGLRHGLHDQNKLKRNGPYVLKIGQIVENAIKVNELPGREGYKRADVYLGVAELPGENAGQYVVRMIVNVAQNGRQQLGDIETGLLYAHTGEKSSAQSYGARESGAIPLHGPQDGSAAVGRNTAIQGRSSGNSPISVSSPTTITIADFLQTVNDLKGDIMPGVLSQDVKNKLGRNVKGDLGGEVQYSKPINEMDEAEIDAELERLEDEIWSGNSEDVGAAMDRRDALEARQEELAAQAKRGREQRKQQREAQRVAWEISRMEEQLEALYKQRKKLGGRVLPGSAVRAAATHLLAKYDSRYDRATMVREVNALFENISQNPEISVDEAMESCVSLMRDVLGQSVHVNTEAQDYYRPVKERLKSGTIEVQRGSPLYHDLLYALGDGKWSGVRQAVRNKLDLRLVPHAGNADTFFAELAEDYPSLFDAEANAADNIERALAVAGMAAPVYENVYGMDIDAAAAVAGQELFAEYLHMPEWNSREEWQKREREKMEQEFRGRIRTALADQRAGYEAQLQAARKNKGERIANLRAKIRNAEKEGRVKDAEKYRRQLEKYRTDTDEKTLKLQAMFENRETRRMEDRRRSAAREGVDRQVRRLSRWLLAPTNQAYIQDRQKKAVTDLLNAFDWNTARPDNEKASAMWKDALSELATVAAQMEKNIPEGWDYVDFDPDLSDMIQKLKESAGDKKMRAGDFNYLQMEMARDILQTVTHSITNANRLLVEGQRQSLAQAANSAISEMEELQSRQVRERNTILGRLWNKASDTKVVDELAGLAGIETMDAGRYFAHLGPTAQKLYQNLRDAFDRRVDKLRDMQTAWKKATDEMKVDDKTLAKWTGPKAEKHKFTLESGKELELTAGQVMELYCLTQRAQAKLHLVQGGILFGDGARGGEKPTHLTATDIANMTGVLTTQQVKFCNWMQEYLSTDVAGWGNEATMRQYGVRKFTEGHYWPISSEKNMQRLTDATVANGSVLRGMHPGFAERTVRNANTALYLHDAVDTFVQHGVAMATYAEMGLAQGDLLRWYNWKEKDNSASVQRALEGIYGRKGKEYFAQFMMDVTGAQAQGGRQGLGVVRGMIRNWKVAKVAFNFRVAVQQPTAYLRALAVLDPGSLVAGGTKWPISFATHNMRRAKDLMRQYCGIAQWKDWGFFESNISTDLKTVIMGQESLYSKVQDWSTGMAELGDRWTWEAIWLACEADVKKRQPGLKFGSEEFNRAVGRRMSEVVDKTQVVDSVFHRSQIMRSNDWLKQTATNFMNEPIKTWNLVRDAAMDLAHANGKQEVREKRMQLARTVAVTAVTALATALAAAFVDGARELPYDDDDEKEGYDRWQRYWRNFWEAAVGYSADDETWQERMDSIMASNLAGNLNMLENIPILKDVLAMCTGEEILRNDTESIKEAVDAYTGLENFLKGKGSKSLYNVAYKAAAAASDLSGIAVSGLLREAKALYNLTAGDPLGLDEPNNLLIMSLVNGNPDTASHLLQGLIEEKLAADHEKTPDDALSDVKTNITKLIKPRYLEADAAERAELESALLALTYAAPDGEQKNVYTMSNFTKWLNDDDRPAWRDALARFDAEAAQQLTDILMERKMLEGKTAKDAASDLRQTVTETMKPLYVAGDSATRSKIKKLLLNLKFDGKVIYTQDDLDKWLK